MSNLVVCSGAKKNGCTSNRNNLLHYCQHVEPHVHDDQCDMHCARADAWSRCRTVKVKKSELVQQAPVAPHVEGQTNLHRLAKLIEILMSDKPLEYMSGPRGVWVSSFARDEFKFGRGETFLELFLNGCCDFRLKPVPVQEAPKETFGPAGSDYIIQLEKMLRHQGQRIARLEKVMGIVR